MKLVTTTLAFVIAAVTSATAQSVIRPFDVAQGRPAQPEELAKELSGYRRSIVYPHLQKGWESVQRGDRARAFAELEQARALAPDSVVVALHLAAAYRQFGQSAQAEAVLRDRLSHNSGDTRLRDALAALRASQLAVAVPDARGTSSTTHEEAVAAERGAQPLLKPLAPPTVARTSPGPRPRASRASVRTEAVVATPAEDALVRFGAALQSKRFDEARTHADRLLHDTSGGATLLDELTYRLMDAGGPEQATALLLQAYPFADRGAGERDLLVQRLALLAGTGPANESLLARLREPLDTPVLRSRQAAFWATRNDCGVVRNVLADRSEEYGYDDWLRLGDCSSSQEPIVARDAYARAQALRPGGSASRALAYQAFAIGEYATALEAWRGVTPDALRIDDVMAAATTAFVAGEPQQACDWLEQYRDRGGMPDYRYWSLRARSSEAAGHPDDARAALEQVVAVRPSVEDYLRLVHLSNEAPQRVQWLRQAASLDLKNAVVQAELGFALERMGRDADARLAFERAAALDPGNLIVQGELGFLYWRTGNVLLAERAFERVWQADRGNVAAAEQLVYIEQRLTHNAQARRYAEHVLDTYQNDGDEAQAQKQFGLQRLHEDLGRRVTITADGWSGTRVGTGTSASRAGDGFRSYSQIEGEIRLGGESIYNGKTVAAYARLIGDSGVERRAVPAQNRTAGVGLRWKPFRQQIFYVAVEQQTRLDGPARPDGLARVSASLFNGGRYSDDWHAMGRGWFAQNLYLDLAQYVKAKYGAATADYRVSYHRKLAGGHSVEPYAHLQVTGVRTTGTDRDVRGGVGARWNVWYGGTRYNADPHKLSIGIEYQDTLETYLPDRNGIFVSVGTRW
jgi:adsorption protein A